jgi:hypothetical protein
MDDDDFDLLQFDTLTLAETGVPMPLIDLRNNQVMRNKDGSEVTITLMGRHSTTFRETLVKIQERRSELISQRKPIDTAQREKEDIATLIACTRDWTIRQLGRQEFPCTAANIRRLWSDERFRSLREIAMAFILGDANFLAPTSSNSSDMLGTNSSSTDLSQAVVAPFGRRSEVSG